MDIPEKQYDIYIEKLITNIIPFYASLEVADQVEKFGRLARERGRWFLTIDHTYAVNQVVSYLASLGESVYNEQDEEEEKHER